jgi:ubiquinone/menaquinone biosynthesis C-methylase UbiE
MICRHCNAELKHTFIDLGSSPPSNSYLSEEALKEPEEWYPLKVMVCEHCLLVQTEDFVKVDTMFANDYAYFSSYSTSLLDHAKNYVEEVSSKFSLNSNSTVVEIAANDGYLLQYIKDKNIPCYGIEPTHNTANAAREKGIEIVEEFFGVDVASRLDKKGRQADLMIANNVLPHVPDINDFVKGFSILLKPNGVATFEFQHLLNLINNNQFDTIYHEHYSYLSLTAVCNIFDFNGLTVFGVEQISTHGGSLRVYAQLSDSGSYKINSNVEDLKAKEDVAGINSINTYRGFQEQAEDIKNNFVSFLIKTKNNGHSVVGYGAAAKASTLLNFSGVRPDLLPYVIDKSDAKQNKFMPGSRVPIMNETQLKKDKPDYIVIFPWNIQDEVIEQLAYIREWGGKFVIFIPSMRII